MFKKLFTLENEFSSMKTIKMKMKKKFFLLFGVYFWLFIPANALIHKDTNCDTCSLFTNSKGALIIQNKKFYPIYMKYKSIEFLGWFYFSNTEVLYVSPIYKEKKRRHPQGNQIQPLFLKKRLSDTNIVYYFDRFIHCKTFCINKQGGYLLKVEWLDPPPSHADVLEGIRFSENLSVMHFIVSFGGERSRICTFELN